MNTIIQNILIFTALTIALGFLVKKYIWNPKKKKTSNGCGDDNCGC